MGCAVCRRPTKTFASSGRSVKFCSVECRTKSHNRRKRMVSGECPNCGEAFTKRRPGGRRKPGHKIYCSEGCYREYQRTSEWGSDRATSCRVYFPTCVSCGRLFCSRHRNHKTCSASCQKQRACAAARRVSERRHNPGRKSCCQCGKQFIPAYGSKRRRLCSEFCARKWSHSRDNPSRRAASLRRAARLRGANTLSTIDPKQIYKRDGWTCQICGSRVIKRRKASHLHPLAATIDHIVPVSLGGAHVESNLQTAHRICNSLKGASERYGQEWLIPPGGLSISPQMLSADRAPILREHFRMGLL